MHKKRFSVWFDGACLKKANYPGCKSLPQLAFLLLFQVQQFGRAAEINEVLFV
jgi:hypothetical protein